jgi:hypothetical protein
VRILSFINFWINQLNTDVEVLNAYNSIKSIMQGHTFYQFRPEFRDIACLRIVRLAERPDAIIQMESTQQRLAYDPRSLFRHVYSKNRMLSVFKQVRENQANKKECLSAVNKKLESEINEKLNTDRTNTFKL